MGYGTNSFVLNAADYGVPQSRHRLFIVGLNQGVVPGPPEPTRAPKDSPRKGLEAHVTSEEAIGKMDDGIDRRGYKTIGGKYGHLMDAIPRGMNYLFYTSRYNRRKA